MDTRELAAPPGPAQEDETRVGTAATKTFLFDFVHLVVLCSFAITRPLLEVLADGATFFVVRGSSATEVVVLAVLVTVLPPMLLATVELIVLAVFGHMARRLTHYALVGLLFALFVSYALTSFGVNGDMARLSIGSLGGIVGAIYYARKLPVRSVLTVLGPAPALFVLLFLFASPVSKALGPAQDVVAPGGVNAGSPIVFVVFDEFSGASLMDGDRKIDAVRFPNFAALAASSTWFPNASTVSLATDRAVPALLTGLYPKPKALPLVSNYPQNLFTLLRGRYAMNVHETLTHLCPSQNCLRDETGSDLSALVSDLMIVSGHTVLPRLLSQGLPSVQMTWGSFRGSELEGRALTQHTAFGAFVNAIQPTKRPSVNFLHVELPHIPWRYLESGRQYDVPALTLEVPGLEPNDVWGGDVELVRQAEQRYLLQLGYVDRLLGRLLARLRAIRVFDHATVVVTADHGVSFHAGEGRRVTEQYIQDLAFVPLFIKLPNQRKPRVVERVVRSIDVLPTIVAAAGLRLPWAVDGASALGPVDARSVTVEGQTYSSAEMIKNRDRALPAHAREFGAGRPWLALLRSGRHGRLIGLRSSKLARTRLGGLRATIDDKRRFAFIDLKAQLVPALVSGRVVGSAARAGRDIAIAVNGRVAGLGRTYGRHGSIVFSALIAEGAYRQGRNEIEVFAVAQDGADTLFQSLVTFGRSGPATETG